MSTGIEWSVELCREALRTIESSATQLSVYSSDNAAGGLASVGKRRKVRRMGQPDPISSMNLVLNREGVLIWQEESPNPGLVGRRGMHRSGSGGSGKIVDQYHFEKLEPNEVGAFLRSLDDKLTPLQGLMRLKGGVLGPVGPGYKCRGKSNTLVIVHGTFSNSENVINGIKACGSGADFLARIERHYKAGVFAFSHPTLSVSPILNAYDLGGLFSDFEGDIDVVAHSRGGLVTRWWLEAFGNRRGNQRRAVLVGSPLQGTSLASPPQLKSTLSALTNIGMALKTAGAAASVWNPFLIAPLGLLKVVTSVTSVAAKTPVIDAAVAMIPGLAAQSRVSGNPELERIRDSAIVSPLEYYVVKANFQTESAGWKFWKWFRKDKLLDAAADQIFPGDNDLVVDTQSMTEFSVNPFLGDVCDFGTSATVHHTNYFEQDKTLDFIAEKFKIP